MKMEGRRRLGGDALDLHARQVLTMADGAVVAFAAAVLVGDYFFVLLLADHFRLAVTNPIMQVGQNKLDAATRNAVLTEFASSDPAQAKTLPIIPLCGTAAQEVLAPARAIITAARVQQIENWITQSSNLFRSPWLRASSVRDSRALPPRRRLTH